MANIRSINGNPIVTRADDVVPSIAKNTVRGQTMTTNLFDRASAIEGQFVRWSNGAVVSDSSFCCSDYIEVEVGLMYYAYVFVNISGYEVPSRISNVDGYHLHLAYFDSSKNYLSGSYDYDRQVVPENCKYVRVSIKADIDYFYYGPKAALTRREPYGSMITIATDTVDSTDRNREKVIGKKTPNVIDPSMLLIGKYIDYTSGRAVPQGMTLASGFAASDYIPVGDNTQLYAYSELGLTNGNSQLAFYDEDYQYISGILSVSGNNVPVDIPEGTAYVAVTCRHVNGENRVCWAFEPVTKFYEYGTEASFDVSEITVALDGTGDYTSVTEAVRHATSGDVIKVKNGVYDDEAIEAWGKDISIIGESRLSTIIRNGSNTYETPPIEMDSGVLENLTIDSYGTDAPTGATGWTSYGMHVEGNNLYNNELLCRNVTFKSAANSGVGVGLRGGGQVAFENCRFVSGSGDAVFFHDAANINYAGVQRISFKDCVFYSERSSGTRVLRIDSQKTLGTTVYPEFINNVFAVASGDTPTVGANNQDNTGGTSTEVGTFYGLINFYKVPTSIGNSIDGLNY